MFSRFDTNHACNGRTDRQTDGIAVVYTRYSIYMLSRVKNVSDGLTVHLLVHKFLIVYVDFQKFRKLVHSSYSDKVISTTKILRATYLAAIAF